MMRLLAHMHGSTKPDRPMGTGRPGKSMLLGLITSGVVIAHLAALGVGGAVLFLRDGSGYSRFETIVLAMLAVVAVLAFWRAGSQMARHRRSRVTGDEGGRW